MLVSELAIWLAICVYGFARGRSFHCGRTPIHPFVNRSTTTADLRDESSRHGLFRTIAPPTVVGSIRCTLHALNALQSMSHLSLTTRRGSPSRRVRAGASSLLVFFSDGRFVALLEGQWEASPAASPAAYASAVLRERRLAACPAYAIARWSSVA